MLYGYLHKICQRKPNRKSFMSNKISNIRSVGYSSDDLIIFVCMFTIFLNKFMHTCHAVAAAMLLMLMLMLMLLSLLETLKGIEPLLACTKHVPVTFESHRDFKKIIYVLYVIGYTII
jgi:hypothetical protein